ncbi:MAG: Rieske (2Fe-2S) protein [Reyranellaceae bacterium]
MKPNDYNEGDAFQAEKQTVFSAGWLPLCAEGQLAKPGAFVALTVGGWSVFAVRGGDGGVRVLRNACRHQNMQVIATPSGHCETFRCRFHGWTYDLQGRFVGAPPPVAPKDPQSSDLHLAPLATTVASGIVFFSMAAPEEAPDLGAPPPPYGGTVMVEIACNWKVCAEHLLADRAPSQDFTWTWPLLAIRRAGPVTIMEQIVPHTFLRTRLLTHVFGRAADDRQTSGTIKYACERLQGERVAGTPAIASPLVAEFHQRLARSQAGSS